MKISLKSRFENIILFPVIGKPNREEWQGEGSLKNNDPHFSNLMEIIDSKIKNSNKSKSKHKKHKEKEHHNKVLKTHVKQEVLNATRKGTLHTGEQR